MNSLKFKPLFQGLFLLIAIFTFTSCGSEEETKSNTSQDKISVLAEKPSTLEIIEDDVPVQNIGVNPFINYETLGEDPIIDPNAAPEPEIAKGEIINPNVKYLGKLKKGSKVKVLQRTSFYDHIDMYADYWYKIEAEGGLRGWVYGKYTSLNLTDNHESLKAVLHRNRNGSSIFFMAVDPERDGAQGYDGDPFDPGYWNFSYEDEFNNYGEFNLIKDIDKYKGKTFEIIWTMKMIKGNYEPSQKPVIVDIRLLD